MKYKCTSTYYIDNKYTLKPNDIVVINGNDLYNITTGVDCKSVSDIESVKKCLEAITDDINTSTTFESITNEMAKIYKKKNHDYGNSFDRSLDKFGLIASVVRLEDKINRLESLINKDAKVNESIKDTLLDLANYSIMTMMWLDK